MALARPAVIGILWALVFVSLEAVQFVFFGNVFQRIDSFLFGALVFVITVAAFVGWAAVARPVELKRACAQPRLLWQINITAVFAWVTYLGAVQVIEPAIAYTIGAGIMPITAWAVHKLNVPEGEALRNRIEFVGILIMGAAMLFLAWVTLSGASGFVRGGWWVGVGGLALAVADGVFFTWLLILCQRIDRKGVGPGVVFGLRFPLYVLAAGVLAAAGVEGKAPLPAAEVVWIVGIGLLLIIPPLYALQEAVALVSTLTIGAITALGPFLIFALQIVEGRVAFAEMSLIGLSLYSVGAVLSAFGAVKGVVALPAD
ncbi:MAG: hypothetical protein AAGH68_10850 [Pseudomonadota bacterium]